MAEPNETTDSGKIAAPESKTELPHVASPPLSPAEQSEEKLIEPVLERQMSAPQVAPQPTAERVTPAPDAKSLLSSLKLPQFKIPQWKVPTFQVPRHAALAATVVLAAGFGAAVGTIANRPAEHTAPKVNTALLEENHALQRSVAKLTKDLGALQARVDASARESRTQIAKVNDRLAERAAEITGSIGKPATVAAAPSAPPIIEKPETLAVTPLPLPRPGPPIVQGWTVREARNGRVLVETRGEFFEIFPGVPLPGLGRVESIRREGDKWVVVTPKGLITSVESTAYTRSRPGGPPYYRPY